MLTKTTSTVHNPEVAYDSGEINSAGISSDTIVPAEYYIDPTTYNLVLNFAPQLGAEIRVIRNLGTVWGNELVSEVTSNSEQVNFLLERPAILPDKYYYGQQ